MARTLLPLAALSALAAGLIADPETVHAPASSPRASSEEGRPVDFAREVRPVLSRACFLCHGPDHSSREEDLRFDKREIATADRGGYRAIEPGNAAASEMFLRISDELDRMPPEDSGFELSPGEIELIRRWIDEGAPYQEHWAFVPPAEPEVPAAPDPDRVENGIDPFILARLAEEGLEPSPPADPRTLLRRVTLDLTGLPPTLAELREFLADESSDAYERVVDRLLASPRYGEHMSRYWLDAARYGDTHGLHLDNYREMWPYRDRVIASFNENQPYDEFVVEQLAGDLLDEPTLEQVIASGFNRCNVSTSEGGSIDEEVYVRNVVDRVSTAGTAFMGLTMGCAVCHDHKFDPISQKEFYGLFAFFNNIDGKPLDGNAKDHAPVVKVPTPEQSTRLSELNGHLTLAEAAVASALAGFEYEEPEDVPAPLPGPLLETVWIDDRLPPGAVSSGDGAEWVEAPRDRVYSGRLALKRKSIGRQQTVFKDADRKLRVGRGDRLFAWVRIDANDPPREIMLQFNDDGMGGWGHRAYWGEDLIEFGESGTPSRLRLGDLPPPGEWTRLEIPVESIGLRQGDVIHGMAFTQFDGTAYWDYAGIVSHTTQDAEDWVWIDDETPHGAALQGDGASWGWVSRAQDPVLSGDKSLRRGPVDGLSQDYFTGAVPLGLERGDRLFAHVWLDGRDPPSSVQLQFHDGAGWNHRARWGAPAHGSGAEGGADFVAGPLPETDRWVRLEVALADVGLAEGARIDGWAFTQVGGTVWWDRAGVRSWAQHDDRFLYSQLAWEERVPSDGSVPEDVRAAVAIAEADRTPDDARKIAHHYLRHVYAGTRALIGPLQARVDEVTKQTEEVDAAVATTLVMRERADPRPAYLLERGQYDARGEELPRTTPAALPPMSADLPVNRLGLARWLVDPGHPLTSRVAVNRLWQQVFGTGLVLTAEDFGNQGAQPTHPELLDWLALRFIEDGWDVKAMLRRLVTSATYRQTSRITSVLVERDPNNRLLARGPRFRLDAETIRDQALLVSGQLVEKIGGPSVKPPQPEGIWKAVAYVGSNTDKFTADTESEKIHRRSLYTFWKRTAPPPQMSTFDAPSREECRVRRERTNTPLQALLLMNDPQFVEAARHLARRALLDGGDTDELRAAYAFELCTSRSPDPADLQDMLELLGEEREAFGDDPAAARSLLGIAEAEPSEKPEFEPTEHAAWTVLANLLLNLDEVLVKR